MDQGFVDLRQNRDAERAGDHFWPTFTDIMTVIVMVFLLASIVLVVRNWQLVEDLRKSMEAERQAWEHLQSKRQENQTLEEQLTMLRMQLMQAQEIAARQGEQLRSLGAERDRLQSALDAARGRLDETEAALAELRQAHQALQDEHAARGQRIEVLQAEVARLQQARDRQRERLASLESARAALQGEYDTLKRKYDRLVRPARTPRGKHVVEVRYRKVNGKPVIRLRDQGWKQSRVVSRKALEQHLARLKEKYPGKLYVKIIIPADSGLSYAEAWRFMKSLLERYDYWYQDQSLESSSDRPSSASRSR